MKKIHTHHFALLLLLILSTTNRFQTLKNHSLNHYHSIADSIIRSSLVEKKGYRWLKELCEIGPRLSGSNQSLEAIEWAKSKMIVSEFDSVWLQPVMVPKWVRNDIESAHISKSNNYQGKLLSIASLGGSIGTPINGLTGKVVEVKSFDELANIANNVKGKIVFFNRPYDDGLVNTFEAYGKAVNQRTNGAIEAAKYGAIGSIMRSVSSQKDNIPHTGVMYYDSTISKIPHASIGIYDADFLSRAISEEPNLEITLNMNCENLSDVLSYNVIGEIKGTIFPDEVIVIGGHFDSWDKGCGAHDDGAPCIQTMEVIELFKRLNIKLKRTIRCVLFINEENGLRGGIEYGKYAAFSKEKHYAAIEADRGAFTPRGFNATADKEFISEMQSWLPVLNKAHIDWIRPGGSGGDVAQIKNAKAWFGFVPDDQRYMDVHHSDNDTFESVHPREMQLGTAAMAIMVYLLSEE
ncbi:MAG: M20/M25/M40 family metallo-hydrolase [Ignavibacteria bacterium]|nr:M20/M25/M40 family metallo-hydrolase [Ignavibacteria bacterium]